MCHVVVLHSLVFAFGKICSHGRLLKFCLDASVCCKGSSEINGALKRNAVHTATMEMIHKLVQHCSEKYIYGTVCHHILLIQV